MSLPAKSILKRTCSSHVIGAGSSRLTDCVVVFWRRGRLQYLVEQERFVCSSIV